MVVGVARRPASTQKHPKSEKGMEIHQKQVEFALLICGVGVQTKQLEVVYFLGLAGH